MKRQKTEDEKTYRYQLHIENVIYFANSINFVTVIITSQRRLRRLQSPLASPVLPDPKRSEYTIKGSSDRRNNVPVDETKTRIDRIPQVLAGESNPHPPEEMLAGGVRRRRHGLQVSPGRLLNEAVPDGDLVAGLGHGRRLDCGGRRWHQVF